MRCRGSIGQASFCGVVVILFYFLFININLIHAIYEPAQLFVGQSNSVYLLDPTNGTELNQWALPDSTAVVRGLTVDSSNRVVYALVTNPEPKIFICNMTVQNGWDNCVVIAQETFNQGGIAYSQEKGVMVTYDTTIATIYFNTTTGDYSAQGAAQQYGQAIQAVDTAQGQLRYAMYLDDTGDFWYAFRFEPDPGFYEVNFTVVQKPTCFAYEPVRNVLLHIAQGRAYYGNFDDITAGSIVPFALTQDYNATAIAVFPYAANASITRAWIALQSKQLFLIEVYNGGADGYAVKNSSVFNYSTTALTYLPQLGSPPIVPPKDAATTASFGATPQFSIAGASKETTQPTYGGFGSAASGTVPFPTSWITAQSQLDSGSGETFDGLTVRALNSSASYNYVWNSALTSNSTLTMNSLYNPVSDLDITTPAGQAYSLPVGAVKSSINIAGTSLGASLFGGDQSATLSWSTCYTNDEAIAQFDLDYVNGTASNGSVATYVFTRNKGGSLMLSIPLQAVADGVTVFVTHTLSPPPTRTGGKLSVCVTWDFPYFDTSLYYDPDIGVLTASGGGSGDGDGSNDDVVKIAVPVAIGGALCCCCIFIIVGVIIGVAATAQRRRTIENSRKFSDAI